MRTFTPSELERISTAVKDAEKRTSGEIVPYVVSSSDHYHEAAWRAGAICGGMVLLGSASLQLFSEVWLPLTPLEVVFIALGAGAVGFLGASLVPAVTRIAAGRETMDHRVRQRAREAFLSEEVYGTHDRTGILIFLSLLERRVVVLGDRGINAKVEPTDWERIVRLIVDGMKRGLAADGLVEAIGQCGALLAQHGVARRADDTDELSDNLRVSKE
jgi:putative membrane protein